MGNIEDQLRKLNPLQDKSVIACLEPINYTVDEFVRVVEIMSLEKGYVRFVIDFSKTTSDVDVFAQDLFFRVSKIADLAYCGLKISEKTPPLVRVLTFKDPIAASYSFYNYKKY